ncbi:hypothetical protein JCM19046_2660 [Bacillus sp. JCM 19046]|nr:hypothetical protein JCM19046_2660 [Bacillus sp. JCM 19046]
MPRIQAANFIASQYEKAVQQPSYRFVVLLCGLPLHLVRLLVILFQPKTEFSQAEYNNRRAELIEQERRKQQFFRKKKVEEETSHIVEMRLKREWSEQHEVV